MTVVELLPPLRPSLDKARTNQRNRIQGNSENERVRVRKQILFVYKSSYSNCKLHHLNLWVNIRLLLLLKGTKRWLLMRVLGGNIMAWRLRYRRYWQWGRLRHLKCMQMQHVTVSHINVQV